MPRKKKNGSRSRCNLMTGDIERIAAVAAGLADGTKYSGLLLGPDERQIVYGLKCQRKGKWGPGDCTVYEITREGPGVGRLRKKTTVGNLYGLITQLSRDAARLWGCSPSPTPGFEGLRRKRTTKRRRR
jgi:hypothetical protein